jgi:hypothetical protein
MNEEDHQSMSTRRDEHAIVALLGRSTPLDYHLPLVACRLFRTFVLLRMNTNRTVTH